MPRRDWRTVELAEVAKVSSAYLRRLLIDGKLKGEKRGRDWFIEDEDAREWLAARGIELPEETSSDDD